MITEGSLLGATRDGFFLPWDSDADLAFDSRAENGTEDLGGFYELFTRREMKLSEKKCPMCKGVTLTHFMDGFKDEDGTELYWWQTFDDILVGNVIEPVTMHHRKVSAATRNQMLQRILNEKIDSRIFPNSLPSIRDGPEYIDVEPFWEDPDSGKWRNLQVSVDKGSMLPTQRCNVLALLDKSSSERLELNCPSRPAAFLDVYYQKQWTTPPYNRYDGNRWVNVEGGPSLNDFLANSTAHFVGLRPVKESPLAGPKPTEDAKGQRLYADKTSDEKDKATAEQAAKENSDEKALLEAQESDDDNA